MARTIPARVPKQTIRTKYYMLDHYRIDTQFTDGKNVPPLLIWLYYKGEPVRICANKKEILDHIALHYGLRKQFDFEHPRYEKTADLKPWELKDDPFFERRLS